MKNFSIKENKNFKQLISEEANYIFDKNNGTMITWGRTKEEDAERFPGPTIADIEVTTICDNNCPFCYKSNNLNGQYMSFKTYKKLFDKLPKSLTQIAFGADARLKSNPDIFKIMQYTRDQGIIPNITVANIDSLTAKKLIDVCGAVAVSRYARKEECYSSVGSLCYLKNHLIYSKLKQVNIHMMIAEETFDQAVETIKDMKTEERLQDVNAIVFLSLKTKGRGREFHPLSQEKFNYLVDLCKENEINYGFDSCSSLKFFKSLNEKEYNIYKDVIMPCESTLESSYINVEGKLFPCSFTEGEKGWEEGLDILYCNDFIKDVWNHSRVEEFRKKLFATKSYNEFNCRSCPYYEL